MRLTVGSGINNYVRKLENLSNATDETLGKAIYEGSKIVADAIKENIDSIPVDEGRVKDGQKLNGLKKLQIVGLKESFGISKSRDDDGYINVKAGFDGYNLIKTKKYPKGQPNAMIARTIESGNSFTRKHPFVAPAVRETREQAEKTMAEIVDNEISKIMK